MFFNSQRAISASKVLSLLESQIESLQALASTAIAGVEKTFALNMATAKASVDESVAVAKQSFSAKNPQEIFSLMAAQAEPAMEKVASYSRAVTEIGSGLRNEFTKVVQAEVAEAQEKVTAVVDSVIKSAPAQLQNALTIPKSAAAPVSAEKLTKASKQAVETVSAEVDKATEPLVS